MSSSIISHQRHNESARNFNMVVDYLEPKQAGGSARPLASEYRSITSINNVDFGQEVTYKLPSHGFLKDAYLRCGFSATSTGEWCNFPALCLVESIKIISGSEVLMEVDGILAQEYLINRLSSEQLTEYLAISGGTAQASAGEYMALLPTPWSNKLFNSSPLFLGNQRSALEIRLKLRSNADMLAASSTGGSLTSLHLDLNMLQSDTNTEIVFNDSNLRYDTYELQSPVVNTAISSTASSVSARGFSGNVVKMYVKSQLTSNFDTAHSYFAKNDIDSFKFTLDHQLFYEQTSSNQSAMKSWAENHKANATLGRLHTVNFSASNNNQIQHGLYSSVGLPIKDYNNVEFEAVVGTDASSMSILGVIPVSYVFENGLIKKRYF